MAAIGDNLQLNVVGQLHGQTTVNTFYYQVTAVGVGDVRFRLTDAWLGTVHDAYRDCCSLEWSTIQIEAAGIQPVLPRVEQVINGLPGTQLGNSLPSSVATVIRRKTLTSGRKGRGRVYMPAVPEDFEDDSAITPAAILVYEALITALSISATTGAWAFGAVHVSRAPLTAIGIDRWQIDPVLRNQRRRQLGRGI